MRLAKIKIDFRTIPNGISTKIIGDMFNHLPNGTKMIGMGYDENISEIFNILLESPRFKLSDGSTGVPVILPVFITNSQGEQEFKSIDMDNALIKLNTTITNTVCPVVKNYNNVILTDIAISMVEDDCSCKGLGHSINCSEHPANLEPKARW